MNLLAVFLWILSFIHFITAIKNPNEKCEFKDTVDLTNATVSQDGTYSYQNIPIPKDKLAFYEYRLEFRNQEIQSESHLRGCVCDASKRIYCTKLCCVRGHFFNETKNQCEPLPENHKEPTDLSIKSADRKRTKTVNIHSHFVQQLGLPCKKPEAHAVDVEWDLLEDGQIYIDIVGVKLDTVSYCLTPHRYNRTNEFVIVPMSCPIPNESPWSLIINSYGMAISVIFLILTVIVYVSIKELRNNLGGKLMISYQIAMATACSFLSYINVFKVVHTDLTCTIIGFTTYFFFMAAFLWLSVLCFDMWNSFNTTNFDHRNCRVRFLMFSVYAWGTATLLTALTLWAQLSDSVPERFKPGIGHDVCFLDNDKWSAALYFYLPNFIIVTFNVCIFTHMTITIYQVRRDVASMTTRDSFLQENAVIIMRLFIVMGISWSMDIISYCTRHFEMLQFLFILTDLCNAAQGVLIFILFVLRDKVIRLIKARILPSAPLRPRFNRTTRETTFSRLTSGTGTTRSSRITNSP